MSYAQQQGSSSSSSGSGAVERGETTIHDQQQQQPTSSSYAAGIASIPEPGPSAAPIPLSSSGSKASQSKQAHKTSSMTKRQQAAHRARILALSKQLATRLQYGMFKVEHGWSNQTHSEVENLYYRHKRSISSGPSPAPARKLSATGGPSSSSSSTVPAAVGTAANAPASISSLASHQPKTPLAFHRPSFSAGGGVTMGAASGPAHLAKKPPAEPVAADVFGGLMTPPASNGAVPSAQRHAEYRNANKLSPVDGGGSALNAASGRANASSTYDDFWSKIGASTSTGATNRSSVGGGRG